MDEKDRVKAIDERIMAAFAAGDADAVAAQYTEDAQLIPPELPTIEGRSAIAEHYREVLRDYTVRLRARADEVAIAGDWAWLRGRFEHVTESRSGGESLSGTGRYLAIARRGADGVWRMHRDAIVNDPSE